MKWRALLPSLRFAFLVAALLTPSSLFAQAQATTGVIRGVATDSSGNPVSAFVTVRNTETNYTRTVKASDQGVFVTTLLPLGTYEVSARAVGYSPAAKSNITVTLGQTVDLPLVLAKSTTQLAGVTVVAQVPTVDPTLSAEATHLPAEVVSALPNNGRNYLNLTLLTPNVAVTQGPDGDVLSVGGQRGIHNNVSVDGADFNNPFFGEQRGGQRPPFTFNLDAVREMVVVAQGANAEFGRSSGGFVNVITKSGTNNMHGTLHYFGKDGALSSDASHANLTLQPDFSQHQFGLTLGGPVVKDKFFYFLAYDQQVYTEVKQKTRPASAAFTQLTNFLALPTTFGGALAQDFGPISRTNDAQVGLVKLDWRINETHNASLKYNYTNSRQANGTFDVDTWGRSANAVEKDFSNAVNGSLVSHLTNTIDNEFRFQFAREDRPRSYSGPINPASGRPFSDTGMDFASGFRFGEPFFIPVKSYDTRVQALDNVSWVRGNHIFKTGFEYNRTAEHQTFVGFANGRFIFNSVAGFQNYVANSNYVECSTPPPANVFVSSNTTGACTPPLVISGPVLLYLQFAGVGGRTAEEAGTQVIPQQDLALFIQDNWKATPNLTVNYGVRWEGQKEADPITPPSQVFFSGFIGQTVTNTAGTFAFPSDGKIPSDFKMFQPRLGIAWDVNGDGKDVVRAAAGLYYARIPGLNLASARSTNGSIGQTIVRGSAFGPVPAYGSLLVPPAAPSQPDIFVFDKDFKNPRTMSASIGYDKEIFNHLAASVAYTYAATDNLTRFVNRNDAVFGLPWSSGLNGTAAGVGVLTTVESSAKSRYNGVTFGLGRLFDPDFQFQANYTLSVDKSDDDNERDPFSFRYARADRLDREYNYSDRDQRHRLNLWALYHFPLDIYANTRFSWYSAQPTSEKCGVGNVGTGARAGTPQDRICPDGSILLRNTIRRDNTFASWDIRLSRPFRMRTGQFEAMVEVFNVLNRDNFRDPSSASLLFNFDGTIRNGLGDPRQLQLGLRYGF